MTFPHLKDADLDHNPPERLYFFPIPFHTVYCTILLCIVFFSTKHLYYKSPSTHLCTSPALSSSLFIYLLSGFSR